LPTTQILMLSRSAAKSRAALNASRSTASVTGMGFVPRPRLDGVGRGDYTSRPPAS
jgi:hypothetical protein